MKAFAYLQTPFLQLKIQKARLVERQLDYLYKTDSLDTVRDACPAMFPLVRKSLEYLMTHDLVISAFAINRRQDITGEDLIRILLTTRLNRVSNAIIQAGRKRPYRQAQMDRISQELNNISEKVATPELKDSRFKQKWDETRLMVSERQAFLNQQLLNPRIWTDEDWNYSASREEMILVLWLGFYQLATMESGSCPDNFYDDFRRNFASLYCAFHEMYGWIDSIRGNQPSMLRSVVLNTFNGQAHINDIAKLVYSSDQFGALLDLVSQAIPEMQNNYPEILGPENLRILNGFLEDAGDLVMRGDVVRKTVLL